MVVPVSSSRRCVFLLNTKVMLFGNDLREGCGRGIGGGWGGGALMSNRTWSFYAGFLMDIGVRILGVQGNRFKGKHFGF